MIEEKQDTGLVNGKKAAYSKVPEGIPVGLSVQWPVIQITRALKNMATAHRKFFRMDRSDLKSIYIEQAKTAEAQGNLFKAILLREKAIALEPKDPDTLYELGLSYEKNGSHDDALHAYQAVVDIRSNYAKAHYRIGVICLMKKKYEDAIKAFEIVEKIKPDSEHLFYRMGQAFDRMQDHEKAIEFFQKAVEVNRDFLPAYKNMALTYDSMNNHKEALECLKRALEIEELTA